MRVVKGYEAGRKALDRGALRVWDSASPDTLDRIESLFGERLSPRQAVQRVLDDVREHGDAAVRRYAEMLDGGAPDSLEATVSELRAAYDETPQDLRSALHTAADRVRAFHEACLPKSWMDPATGLGEQFTAMARAGLYAPGGQAAYPSTVLMTAVPARVAGVDEVVLATPSQQGMGPNPAVLAAAYVAGVDRVFQIGGAQAIAAMAYGTESVPKVDIVCGPGNIFVTLAKQMVYGEVAVDGLYGPTETLVIADASVDPVMCAADLLAQAEHDTLASPVLITTSAAALDGVCAEIERQLRTLPKRDIASAAIENQGFAVLGRRPGPGRVAGPTSSGRSTCASWSRSHGCCWAAFARRAACSSARRRRRSRATTSPDPSHVMPTGGTARFNSALGVHQFLKVTSVIGLDDAAFHALGEDAARLAEAEGLEGHARAARLRLDRAPSPRHSRESGNPPSVRPELVEGQEGAA